MKEDSKTRKNLTCGGTDGSVPVGGRRSVLNGSCIVGR